MCVELLERHNNVRELQRIQSSFRLRKVFGDRNVHKMLPTDGEKDFVLPDRLITTSAVEFTKRKKRAHDKETNSMAVETFQE